MPSNLHLEEMTENMSCYLCLSWQESCKLIQQLAVYCTLPCSEFHLLLTALISYPSAFLEKDLVCIYEREKTGPRVSVYKDFKVFLDNKYSAYCFDGDQIDI